MQNVRYCNNAGAGLRIIAESPNTNDFFPLLSSSGSLPACFSVAERPCVGEMWTQTFSTVMYGDPICDPLQAGD